MPPPCLPASFLRPVSWPPVHRHQGLPMQRVAVWRDGLGEKVPADPEGTRRGAEPAGLLSGRIAGRGVSESPSHSTVAVAFHSLAVVEEFMISGLHPQIGGFFLCHRGYLACALLPHPLTNACLLLTQGCLCRLTPAGHHTHSNGSSRGARGHAGNHPQDRAAWAIQGKGLELYRGRVLVSFSHLPAFITSASPRSS